MTCNVNPKPETPYNKMLHTESRVARFFEIKIVRRDPVNIDVIRLESMVGKINDD